MKKSIKVITIIILAIGLIYCWDSSKDYYHKDVIITDVEDNLYTLEDSQGHLWELYEEDEVYFEDNTLTLLMRDTGLKGYTLDDIIVKVL